MKAYIVNSEIEPNKIIRKYIRPKMKENIPAFKITFLGDPK